MYRDAVRRVSSQLCPYDKPASPTCKVSTTGVIDHQNPWQWLLTAGADCGPLGDRPSSFTMLKRLSVISRPQGTTYYRILPGDPSYRKDPSGSWIDCHVDATQAKVPLVLSLIGYRSSYLPRFLSGGRVYHFGLLARSTIFDH